MRSQAYDTMSDLTWNRYGKSRDPALVQGPHGAHGAMRRTRLVDLTIDVQLEGAFEAVYVDGDNAPCLATDTMKNTVYALARSDPIDHVEAFALPARRSFRRQAGRVARRASARVEHRWDRLSVGGRPHPHAFVQPGGEQWTAVVTRDANGDRRSSPG